MKRRTFIAGGLGALGLLAGGIFWAKGTLYRKAANSMRQLTGDLDAQFLRQVITADSAHSRMLMWQAESPLVNPGIFLPFNTIFYARINQWAFRLPHQHAAMGAVCRNQLAQKLRIQITGQLPHAIGRFAV